jgi:hypothetical protein
MLVGGLPIGNTGMQGMIVIFGSLEAHVHIQKYAISQSTGLPYCGGESVAEGFPCAGAWILRFERQGRDWSCYSRLWTSFVWKLHQLQRPSKASKKKGLHDKMFRFVSYRNKH